MKLKDVLFMEIRWKYLNRLSNNFSRDLNVYTFWKFTFINLFCLYFIIKIYMHVKLIIFGLLIVLSSANAEAKEQSDITKD
jgi:hypothetical protein